MDLNLVVLVGSLAAPPEVLQFEGGSRCARLLISAHTTLLKNRLDVLPVVWWNPDEEALASLDRGTRVSVTGSLQRRFFEKPGGRSSRVEVIANQFTSGGSPGGG